ncbi:nucleoid-associated protein [Pedobacter hartonius]|uniref:Nucleoid-associated protein YejK n=1 Tax=Pedobacter hartonius TaxID=425514 RepID=A0A1H4F5D3_9SPHI|nr:nucleoid-associated protein [Pedobacter hartonius]SEA92493.1 Nucleoid-associated protein YejK [Pedobacter hartonius]
MNVNRIIIHELIKEAQSTEIEYKSSSDLITVNEGINKLIEHVHESFDQTITKYSKFDLNNSTNAVYSNISKYLKEENSTEQFIKFSKASLGDLAILIRREPFATGGFYLFVDYVENGYNFISIIIVRNKDAFNINWNGDNFDVGPTENLNIDKLAMGFRINCDLYLDKEDTRNYIALISNQGDALSKYFTTWVNAGFVIDSKINTQHLINVIKDIGVPEGFPEDEDFDKIVHDWIESYRKQNKNKINVDILSESLYKDKLAIRNHAQEKFKIEIDPIFSVNGTELNRLVRYKATTKGIAVSLDSDTFKNGEVALENGMLIIRNEKIFNQLSELRKK